MPPDELHHIHEDIRASLADLRRIRTHPDCPPRHTPALDDAIAANERALAQLEALTTATRDVAT